MALHRKSKPIDSPWAAAVDPSWFGFVRLSDVAAVANVAAVRAAAAASAAAAAGSAAVAAAAAGIAVAAATVVAVATKVAGAAGTAAAAAVAAAAGCLLLMWYLAIAAATVLLQALDLDEAMLLMQRLHSVCLLWWSFCGRVTAEKKRRGNES